MTTTVSSSIVLYILPTLFCNIDSEFLVQAAILMKSIIISLHFILTFLFNLNSRGHSISTLSEISSKISPLGTSGCFRPRASRFIATIEKSFFFSRRRDFFFKLIFDIIKKKLFCYFDIFFYHCYEIRMYILLFVIVVLTFWRSCRVCWLVYGQTDRLYNSVRTWSYTLSVSLLRLRSRLLLIDCANCWIILMEYVLTYVRTAQTYLPTYIFCNELFVIFRILRLFT